jgi:hypothetical protein
MSLSSKLYELIRFAYESNARIKNYGHQLSNASFPFQAIFLDFCLSIQSMNSTGRHPMLVPPLGRHSTLSRD